MRIIHRTIRPSARRPNVKFSGPPGPYHQTIDTKREGGSAATRVRQPHNGHYL